MRRALFLLVVVMFIGGCIKRSRLFAPQTAGSAPVLIELFSNDACVHCPEAEEIIDSLMESDTNLYLITYHIGTPDPQDPFYLADSGDINARITYYYGSTTPGTPYVVISGTATYMGTSGAPSWGAKISELHNREYTKILNFSGVYNESARAGTLTVTLDTTVSGRIRVALVESGVRYQAPNGDTLYNYLLRNMPGGADGLSGPVASFPFQIDPGMNEDSVNFIVFLQNDNTKEVLDVAKIALDELSSSTPSSLVDVYTRDSTLSVIPGSQIASRIYVHNMESFDDTFYLTIDRDSLDPIWMVSLCGDYCLPFLHTVDTVATGTIDSTYQVEFYHQNLTDPSGVVWIKVWSLTDTTVRDSFRLSVEAGK